MIIKVTDLYYRELFKGLELFCEHPMAIGIVGVNGSGKTTLLKLLCSLLTPENGSVELMGKKVQEYKPGERAQIISYLSADLDSVSGLTLIEYISLGMQKERCENVWPAIERFGLSDLSKKVYDKLSSGQKRRAMLARIMAQDTPIILLDEPSSFLDKDGQDLFIGYVMQLKESKKTILFTTHHQSEVQKTADRVWTIENSKVTTKSSNLS